MKLEVRDQPNGKLLGTAYVRGDGVAVVTGSLRTFDGKVLFDRETQPITQEDGDRWIRALRREFRTPYAFAKLVDDRTEEERRRRAERFIWRSADIVWLTPPHPKCVACGSGKLLRIIYGLPQDRPETGTVSGGCIPATATHACMECGHRFQRKRR